MGFLDKIFGKSLSRNKTVETVVKKDELNWQMKKDNRDMYSVAMSIIAQRLKKYHGKLLKVYINDNRSITLFYEDSTEINVQPRVVNPEGIDLGMMDFGYSGTHPKCFYQFLMENGYNITMDQIENLTAPEMFELDI